MDAADKRMLEREALRNMIQQWNANRLDLFELSEPNENLEFHGVMRFYFQDSGQKIATKCIRVASDATVSDVIETLIEKFRPDMRMLSLGSYSLWETHGPDDERRLEPHEKPLLVQLNWHADDREGRFLLKCLTNNEVPISAANDKGDQNFKRKLSKREKKELKKKEKLSRLKSDTNDENRPVAEKLYTELPETSFTRSISNPEAVMRRRRQQKLERKLQQFRSKDGGPDTGGTLKIYGSSLCPDVPYKTLLVSVRDSAAGVLREMLDKYGLARHEPRHYCLVQVDTRDNSEYVLEDDECPLAIVMTHHNRGSIMFHVRRRPADTQPRRRKKKAGSSVSSGGRPGNDPALVEVAPDGSNVENGRRLRITDVVEVGSGNGTALQLYGPSIQSRHCVIAPAEGGGYTVTPLHTDAHVYVNGRRTMHSQRLQHGCLLKFGRVSTFRFVDPAQETILNRNLSQSQHFGSGSIYDRMGMGTLSSARPGAEAILPAVLEFPEAGQPQFLAHVITRLDPHAPAFKLAPVYTLYLCARYRASTHYRPELTPTERAHKLTAFLHHVATLIHTTVQERCTDSAAQAFWMANASELLHFLKCDRHISSFSTQAQDLLPSTVQNAFSNLVSCFQEELSRALSTLTNPAVGDPNEATGPTVQVLASAMVLLRRCRVNAALTIQLFSHLFHYINAVCFNKLVTEPGAVSGRWGSALAARLALLAAWAERQGLELAADCHLARTHQAARLIQGSYRTAEEARAALSACFKLNSVQVRALLSATSSADVVQAAVAHARALADELCRADGREIRLEESTWLGAALLIPGDGFSAEVVRGVPPGLAEFVAPLQRGGLCRLAHQPHAVGVWTVYLAGYGMPRRTPDPRVQVIQLHKNANGMGLSIVAAKGAGQSKLGIYIKSVVPGGAAALDGRLAAGDQLLSVDGQSLRGITQEKAAEYLVRTGPTVTLEIAKQGAVLHGLATLLHQPATTPEHKPAPGAATGATALRRASERDLPSRLAAEPVKPSKSTPALHQHLNSATLSPTPSAATVGPAVGTGSVGNVGMAASAAWAGKSRSSHNLAHDAFYQNLPGHNHALQDRWSSLRSSNGSNRPQSAHYSAGDQQPDSPVHSQQNKQAMSARAAKLAEMSEEVSRRQQPPPHYQPIQQKPPLLPHHHVGQQGPMSPTQMHMHNQHYAQQGPMSPGPMSPGPMSPLSPGQGPAGPNMQHYHNHNQNPPQRYEWHQAGPPSPQRSQPPVAPKPQQNMRRPETETDDRELEQVQQTNNLQHAHANNAHQANNSVQPDDERYVASALEPPAVAVYGVGAAAGGGGRPAPAHNPWQREERERQLEARRQANRARRDATIAQLLSLGAARSAVQSQQLRALQLEREFERRATQHQQEDNNAAEGVEAPPSPPPSPATHPPPKSILKVNTRQDVNGYPPEMPAPQQQQQQQQQQQPLEETGAAELSSSLSQMSVAPPPPPPPARGSSFAAMAGRARALSPPLALAPADAAHAQPPQSPSSTRDKRVSFHERAAPSPSPSPSPAAAAAAPPPSQASAPPAPPSSSPPPLEPEHQHYSHTPQREDPDRFIEEAASMLSSPPSPPSAAPHLLSLSHTPGVIGAQEVYRDPRARRLAAQRASEVAGALPEQLSFKEKMKMFALESGENSTPKDKVKISRAQRDIDAVH
ncbi:afadin isoform X5 [Plodia interpunctella]|uniref:afadin isoform X5 n=1 Tax=Plodia interpunctella TaxID=58824 RepID=UPI0023677F1F|nr:afadin isoform X5 [Plodia interpunctella]